MITSVSIPLDEWEEIGDGDPKTRLLATLNINGRPHHMEAIQVRVRDGAQEAANPSYRPDVNHLLDWSGVDFQTQRIGRRNYIVVVTPYGV